jgi:uncharacterized protein
MSPSMPSRPTTPISPSLSSSLKFCANTNDGTFEPFEGVNGRECDGFFTDLLNCHDIQAEAQREYGLTPDDVHESFNFFMHTGIDGAGHPFIARQIAKKGDYVDLLALFDVLAVPNVCGADVMATSDFCFKPIALTIFKPCDEALAAVPEFPKVGTQRTPADFKVKTIKADRVLRRDPNYLPEFTNVPIWTTEVAVTLDSKEAQALEVFKATGGYGGTDAEVLRYVLFSWWIERFMKGPKHFDDLKS